MNFVRFGGESILRRLVQLLMVILIFKKRVFFVARKDCGERVDTALNFHLEVFSSMGQIEILRDTNGGHI